MLVVQPPPPEPPLVPANQAAADLLAAWRGFAAATATAPQVETLVLAYEALVFGESPLPPGLPEFAELEATLRAAVAAKCNRRWQAFFEQAAATRCIGSGDVAQLASAVGFLDDFVAEPVDEPTTDTAVGLMLASLQRTLGDLAACFATLDLVGKRLGPRVPDNAWLHGDLAGELSEALRMTGRIDEASVAARDSLAIAMATGDQRTIQRALHRNQAVALATGRFQSTADDLTERLAAGTAAGAPPADLALLRLFLGYALAGLAGDDVTALREVRGVLDEARRAGDGHLRRRADLKRFDLALRSGDLEVAASIDAECGTSFGAIAPSPVPALDTWELVSLRARLALARGARGEALDEHASQLAAAVAAVAADWHSQPLQLGGTGFLQLPQRRDLIGAAIDVAIAHDAENGIETALSILLGLQTCTSLARVHATPPCPVAELRASLGHRAALVYLPTPTGTHAFLVEADGVRYERLPGDCGYDGAVLAMLEALAGVNLAGAPPDDTSEALLRCGQAARDRLLPAAWLPQLAASAGLTIVGAELLGGLPFEALPLDGDRLLGEVVPIDNTASLPLAVATARRHQVRPAAQASLLLFACTDPVPTATDAPVASIRFPEEILLPAVADYHPLTKRLAGQATAAALRDVRLADYDIVHFVLHAAGTRAEDREPGLLAYDGPVWRPELAAHPCRGLVVVSCCGGGRGPRRSGEGSGFHSLAGTFLWNGAEAVIASTRDLEARAHLQLLAACHRHLLTGSSPAAALRSARAECAQGHDLWTRCQAAMVQVLGAGQLPLFRR